MKTHKINNERIPRDELIRRVEKIIDKCGKIGFMSSIGYKCIEDMVRKGYYKVVNKSTGELLGVYRKNEFVKVVIKDGFNPKGILDYDEPIGYPDIGMDLNTNYATKANVDPLKLNINLMNVIL